MPALYGNATGEMAMPASSLRTRKVRALRMSAKDREFEDKESKDRQFEDLLRRAAEVWKSRQSPTDGKGTETRESLQIPERDSDM
jgi:hypothetical protein